MAARILVVDDEPDLLRMVGYALKAKGYDIVTATSGAEALSKVQSERPDLMVLDLMLPDMNGNELCEHLRSHAKTATLPIIMLTARTRLLDKVKGLESGADEYVTKPVEMAELTARVGALLERTGRLRQVPRASQGRTLAFLGAKGGVGTTTVALNVALTLLKQDKSVITAEVRSNLGSFSAYLGMTPVATLSDLLPKNETRLDERDVSMHLGRHPSGLQVLFSPQRVPDYCTIEPQQIEKLVRTLVRMADFTILDIPNYPSETTRAALSGCEAIVVVTEPEPVSLAAARATLEMIKGWGFGGTLARAVVVNRNGSAHGLSLPDSRAQLGCDVVGVMPRVADLGGRMLSQGKPLVLAEPNSAAALALIEMTERLVTHEVLAF